MGISMNIPLSMQLVDTWLLCLPTSPVASGHSKREHQHHVTLLYSGKEDTIQLRLFQRCIDLLLVMIIMIEAFQTEWDSIRTPILARLCTSGTIRVQMAFAFVLSGACRAVVGRWMDKDGLRISEVRFAFSGLRKKGLAPIRRRRSTIRCCLEEEEFRECCRAVGPFNAENRFGPHQRRGSWSSFVDSLYGLIVWWLNLIFWCYVTICDIFMDALFTTLLKY